MESERTVNGERERIGRRHFISSLPGDAEKILGSVRSHWEVENSVRWTLDVTFGEDASRARRGDSDMIMALFRRAALNLLRSEKIGQGEHEGEAQAGGLEHGLPAQGAYAIRCVCPGLGIGRA